MRAKFTEIGKYIATLSMLAIIFAMSGLSRHFSTLSTGKELAWILLAATCSLAVITLRALRWNVTVVALGRPMNPAELFKIYGAAFFLGVVTPGRMGELAKIWLGRPHFRSSADATSSVLLDRVFDVLPGLVMTAVLLGGLALTGGREIARWLPASIITSFAAILVAAIVSGVFMERAGRFIRRVGVLFRLKFVDDAPMLEVFDLWFMLKMVGFSLCSQMLLVLQSQLLAQSAGGSVNAWLGYSAVIVGNAAAALPISIGGFGARELTAVGILMAVGVNRDAAGQFAIASFASNAIVAALSGIPFLLMGLSRPRWLEQFQRQ